MSRRRVLQGAAVTGVAASFGPQFWNDAYAANARRGVGPYGPLQAADRNGVRLPKGFTSRIIARTGQVVPGTSYTWHANPDGGAVFAQPGGEWVYTSNSEAVPNGGAGALKFDRTGRIVDAYRILSGTISNCAGGPTPWGTWLSAEEHEAGFIHECNVTRKGNGRRLPALGAFSHEAVTVDPVRQQLYLTEDDPDGRFYRFTPANYPNLSVGKLEALSLSTSGVVGWVPIAIPELPQILNRPRGTKSFDGGEGVWYDSGHVYFTTKGDNKVWDLDIVGKRLGTVYDASVLNPKPPLTGVDNVVVSRSGDIFVAEDGGDLEINMITPDRIVCAVMQLKGHDASEITGPAFSPDGSRLYFSSQRGTNGTSGMTFEVRGPFRTTRTKVPARAK